MARGFLSGVLWGGVVGLGVAGVASVIAPLPGGPQVVDTAPDAAQIPQRIEPASSGAAANRADSAPATGTAASQASAPPQDAPLALDADTLATPEQVQVPSPSALAALDTEGTSAQITVTDEPGVVPTPQALAPMEPQKPDGLEIDTAPADPVAADLPKAVAEAIQKQADATDAPAETPEQPATAEVPLATPGQPQTAIVTPNATPDVNAGTTIGTTIGTTANDSPVVLLKPVAPPAGVVQPQDPAGESPSAGVSIPDNGAGSGIGTQVGSLVGRDSDLTIRRPGNAALGNVDNSLSQDAVAEAPTDTADARPITRFAASFDRDADKPLMSIVLIDDGSSLVTGSAGIAALRGFPYPLSFAVDTTLSDAVERMELYRKEGFEVLAMVDLPQGAQPADAEIAFGVVLSRMNEVVGVLEGPDGGLQGSREVADQVTSILLQTGHGLLTQDKGLNTMPKLARKEGVPADPIFRDFDSKGQTAAVIRRFLDQAAFKAGQEGAVVMLGRLRPDTVSALLLWGLQDRAGKVSLAPVSAVLTREE